MLITLRPTFGAQPQPFECTWPQLVDWLKQQSHTVAPTKDSVCLVAFGSFAGGFKREQLNPEGLWALALDLDHVPIEKMGELVLLAPTLGSGLMHTTYSHGCTPGEARVRVLYPLPGPVNAGDYVDLWLKAVAVYAAEGFEVDPATGNPERCWYIPAINPNAPEWAQTPWLLEF